jgi:alkylation response protein AidB-like acyl-CoA dehydrogenase
VTAGSETELLDALRELTPSIRRGAADWEAAGAIPRELLQRLGSLGVGAMVAPPALGGAGLSNRGALAAFEVLAHADLSLAFVVLVQNSTARAFLQHGGEHRVPRFASFAEIGAIAITEPDAGSDVRSLATTAERAGDAWVLEGHKVFATNAAEADSIVVCAKSAGPGQSGRIGCFVIERGTPGLDVGPRHDLLGARAMAVWELSLSGCRIDADAVLGDVEDGLRIALHAVTFARVMWGGLAVGLARAAFEEARDYARERSQFGERLSDFQAVRFTLADLATEIEAASALAERAADSMDSGGDYLTAASMSKRFAGDMAVRVTAEALQLLGGRGYLVPSPLERYLRQARMAQIADGTANIQRLVVARAVVDG